MKPRGNFWLFIKKIAFRVRHFPRHFLVRLKKNLKFTIWETLLRRWLRFFMRVRKKVLFTLWKCLRNLWLWIMEMSCKFLTTGNLQKLFWFKCSLRTAFAKSSLNLNLKFLQQTFLIKMCRCWTFVLKNPLFFPWIRKFWILRCPDHKKKFVFWLKKPTKMSSRECLFSTTKMSLSKKRINLNYPTVPLGNWGS